MRCEHIIDDAFDGGLRLLMDQSAPIADYPRTSTDNEFWRVNTNSDS